MVNAWGKGEEFSQCPNHPDRERIISDRKNDEDTNIEPVTVSAVTVIVTVMV